MAEKNCFEKSITNYQPLNFFIINEVDYKLCFFDNFFSFRIYYAMGSIEG